MTLLPVILLKVRNQEVKNKSLFFVKHFAGDRNCCKGKKRLLLNEKELAYAYVKKSKMLKGDRIPHLV
jgi:hypothetical protein